MCASYRKHAWQLAWVEGREALSLPSRKGGPCPFDHESRPGPFQAKEADNTAPAIPVRLPVRSFALCHCSRGLAFRIRGLRDLDEAVDDPDNLFLYAFWMRPSSPVHVLPREKFMGVGDTRFPGLSHNCGLPTQWNVLVRGGVLKFQT